MEVRPILAMEIFPSEIEYVPPVSIERDIIFRFPIFADLTDPSVRTKRDQLADLKIRKMKLSCGLCCQQKENQKFEEES